MDKPQKGFYSLKHCNGENLLEIYEGDVEWNLQVFRNEIMDRNCMFNFLTTMCYCSLLYVKLNQFKIYFWIKRID